MAGQAIHQREDQVGQLSRETEQLRRDQLDRERQAISDERARIARELHDIVAHSISVITIQTQAGPTASVGSIPKQRPTFRRSS